MKQDKKLLILIAFVVGAVLVLFVAPLVGNLLFDAYGTGASERVAFNLFNGGIGLLVPISIILLAVYIVRSSKKAPKKRKQ